jgi:multidrug efflux pump subunit AcrA (membrane-fusion protein)
MKRAESKLYKRIRWAALTVIALAALSVGGYKGYRAWVQPRGDLTPLVMTLEPRDFTINISANGELQSAESLTIAVPPVPAQRLRIASVVREGTFVNKGDPLVEFDPTELDLKAMEHHSDLDIANQKISKGEMASQSDRTDVMKDKKIAELELNKLNEFLPKDEQIYSRREIIEGQLDQNYTRKKIVFADARLELKGKVYSLDEAILMLERNQADARIKRVDTARASLKLTAPASGIVVYNDPGYFFGDYTLMPGRVVYVGMTLFNLVNPNKMEARCYVLEKDAGELRADQTATVVLDPFPGREFTGKVRTIDKLARPIDRGSPVKYFQTMILLDGVDTQVMKPGVKLKATIKAGELNGVLVVPRSAIVKKDEGLVAYVSRGAGRFEPVPVALGQGDMIQVVVMEGLEAGQTLALNPPDVRAGFTAKKKNGESADKK